MSTDGELLVNELAPRPHNSGHLTFDFAVTSQFEQQVRAVCGLPLGSPEIPRPAAMANLLGDLWEDGEPNWAAACRFPDVKLHLRKNQSTSRAQDGPPCDCGRDDRGSAGSGDDGARCAIDLSDAECAR